MKAIFSTLIRELHAYAKSNRIHHAVLGISGGLDSSIALCAAVRAFGAKNVSALILPETGLTPDIDIDHAKALANHFGVVTHYHSINNHLVDFNFLSWKKTQESTEELKSSVRAMLLRYYARTHKALWISAANKSDLLLGLGTQEGELGGDLYLLGDLYKSDLVELAKHIGLPDELIEKAPSRHIKPCQSDAEDLCATWTQIDDVLRQINNKIDPEVLIEKGMDSLLVHKVARMVQAQTLKRRQTPIIPIGDIKKALKEAQEAEAAS